VSSCFQFQISVRVRDGVFIDLIYNEKRWAFFVVIEGFVCGREFGRNNVV